MYHAGWVIPIKFDHDDDDNTKDWIPFLVVHLLAFLPLSDLLSKILVMTIKVMFKFDDNDDNTKDWIPLLEVYILVFLSSI